MSHSVGAGVAVGVAVALGVEGVEGVEGFFVAGFAVEAATTVTGKDSEISYRIGLLLASK